MGRGKAYTQEQINTIWEAYTDGFSIEHICKYVEGAQGRSRDAIRSLIRKLESEQETQESDEVETQFDTSGIVEELQRMNDLKLKELDLLQEIRTAVRNTAVNTLNISKELDK